jgi:hypothetical protein
LLRHTAFLYNPTAETLSIALALPFNGTSRKTFNEPLLKE